MMDLTDMTPTREYKALNAELVVCEQRWLAADPLIL